MPQWETFGRELKRLRLQSSWSQRQLAARSALSPAMIGALERGTRTPKPDTTDKLDAALATSGLLSRVWQDLSSRRDVPEWFRDALSLERKATEILELETLVIPGLLQTVPYAQELEAGQRRAVDKAEVAHVVETRTTRIQALRTGVSLSFVIPQRSLEHMMGNAEIMAAQLKHIEEAAQTGVIIQVTTHPVQSVRYPFRVMMMDPHPVAYVEHADGGSVVDQPERVERLEKNFYGVQRDALPPQESLYRVKEIRNAFEYRLH